MIKLRIKLFKLNKLIKILISSCLILRTIFGITEQEQLQLLSIQMGPLNTRYEALKPKIKPVKFGQTEAYLSIPDLSQTVKDCYMGGSGHCPMSFAAGMGAFHNVLNTRPDIQKIVEDAKENEKKYKDTHFVFYHAYVPMLHILYDFYTLMCQKENKCDKNSPFILMRPFQELDISGKKYSYFGLPEINKWMDNSLATVGTKFNFDHDERIKPFLVSTNLSLFGNINAPGEHTFQYFLTSLSINPPPIKTIFENVLSHYISDKAKRDAFVEELFKLTQPNKIGENKPTLYGNFHSGDLLQIFIPKTIVDQVVYLSKPYGKYWGDYISKTETHKVYDKSKQRYTAISPILSIYQRDPTRLDRAYSDTTHYINPTKLLDGFQGRLLLKGEYFAAPSAKNDIKMFRFSTLDKIIEKNYLKKMRDIVKRVYLARDIK